MSFCRISAYLTVEEKDSAEVKEALLSFIDSMLMKNIRVFESDVCAKAIAEVPDADELRAEIPDRSL